LIITLLRSECCCYSCRLFVIKEKTWCRAGRWELETSLWGA